MKLKYNFLINEIAGNFVAVPVGDAMTEFNGMIKLNDTAAFIFEKLQNDISLDELVEVTATKYGCPSEEARENVVAIIEGLKAKNLLVD